MQFLCGEDFGVYVHKVQVISMLLSNIYSYSNESINNPSASSSPMVNSYGQR